jgi:hypothetical protein
LPIIIVSGKIKEEWLFWFSEKASVNGIKGNVDVNIYNGDLQQLRYITFTICIRYFGRSNVIPIIMIITITKRQPK